MKVKIDNREIEFPGRKTVRRVLQELGLNPEEVVVLKDGEPITEDTMINKDEEIEILIVVSRG
jgi:sulfur carrier protein